MPLPPKPTKRPERPYFSSGPCAKRPGWSLRALKRRLPRPVPSLEGRQGQARRGDRTQPRSAAHARRLAPRHRAGLRHRRHGDGALVAAGPPRRRRARLGVLRPGLGHRHHQAAQPDRRPHARRRLRPDARSGAGRLEPRRGLHLERHHLGRARARRRLDPRPTARAWPSATPPRRSSPWTCPSTSSTWSPTPGRRCWAARRSTAC